MRIRLNKSELDNLNWKIIHLRVDNFLGYLEKIEPRILILANVQLYYKNIIATLENYLMLIPKFSI